jgi:hypothetical protein
VEGKERRKEKRGGETAERGKKERKSERNKGKKRRNGIEKGLG